MAQKRQEYLHTFSTKFPILDQANQDIDALVSQMEQEEPQGPGLSRLQSAQLGQDHYKDLQP